MPMARPAIVRRAPTLTFLMETVRHLSEKIRKLIQSSVKTMAMSIFHKKNLRKPIPGGRLGTSTDRDQRSIFGGF